MPDKCCAPGCRSNYKNSGAYVSVFKFLTDPECQQLWLKEIPREDLAVTKHTMIWVKHFENRFVVTEDILAMFG